MAGNREVGLPKTTSSSLREQLARTTLNTVRARGHPYLELRQDGKRFVFFCILCLSPCYSATILFDHLRGKLHTGRLSAAKATLLKPNPWPFSDGIHFFDASNGNEKQLAIKNGKKGRFLKLDKNSDNLAAVKYSENLKPYCNVDIECNEDLSGNEEGSDLVIQNVRLYEEVSDLKVRFMGSGRIAVRIYEKDDGSNEISRIWCEWLGKRSSNDEERIGVLDHDFSVVTFAYDYDLGRRGIFDDVKLLLSSRSPEMAENDEGGNSRGKRSHSEPGDISRSWINQYALFEEESSKTTCASSKLVLDRYDDQLMHTRFISSKKVRREVRKQQRIAAGKMCDICMHKMLPGKDVATLWNRKTGKLACSSRNVYGAFHVYHTSCLILWMLSIEFEIVCNQSVGPKVGKRSKKKNGDKSNTAGKDGTVDTFSNPIVSVFCPECQGTGVNIEGDELEKTPASHSEVFQYQLKVCDGYRGWMKSPEILDNCSTGFHFPPESGEPVQEKVLPLKLLHFYRAEE
ncbi:hypothetical protein OIU77_006556 [Salix suchowensis]|uniref:ACYL-UDP-N-ACETYLGLUCOSAMINE O-ACYLTRANSFERASE n=2 Tax=Salix TaxID=40685 RepID=A0A9Q0W8A5_9ROSI|nr:hypothetical protein OIU77_006556 [Salix suchowensis]KAJ6761973.1 ACYL-UDP-N-ACETYLGLUCOSAMINE O-ACYLTRANSFERASE [Salix koriyanagi]